MSKTCLRPEGGARIGGFNCPRIVKVCCGTSRASPRRILLLGSYPGRRPSAATPRRRLPRATDYGSSGAGYTCTCGPLWTCYLSRQICGERAGHAPAEKGFCIRIAVLYAVTLASNPVSAGTGPAGKDSWPCPLVQNPSVRWDMPSGEDLHTKHVLRIFEALPPIHWPYVGRTSHRPGVRIVVKRSA